LKDRFFAVAERLSRGLRAGETLLCNLSAERSDFVRFNHARVRQAGSVEQGYLTLRLVHEQRQASATVMLDGEGHDDALRALRDSLEGLPEDPWLLFNESPQSTESVRRGVLPAPQDIPRIVSQESRNLDLVGFYAAGTQMRGFANSLGQTNWHEIDSFDFDFSLHGEGDRAAKSGYAGCEWDADALRRKVESSSREFSLLNVKVKDLHPGEYRCYLAPRALSEITTLLNWGAFSARSRKTRQSPLLRMQEGARLSPKVTLRENTAEGLSAPFQADGFLKPGRVELIEKGELRDALVSPRTAKEYGLETNGAGGSESASSLEVEKGALEKKNILGALGEGLYISNLWYLNFSDRPAGRITGMTRFATFWVEGGRIVAPVGAMRFDDSIYRMLGENLLELTRERELLPDNSTYGERSTASERLPGALLKQLRFTL
jgi:predicted Zn-dependent protease